MLFIFLKRFLTLFFLLCTALFFYCLQFSHLYQSAEPTIMFHGCKLAKKQFSIMLHCKHGSKDCSCISEAIKEKVAEIAISYQYEIVIKYVVYHCEEIRGCFIVNNMECNVADVFLKGGDLCKNAVADIIKEIFLFFEIINGHSFVMNLPDERYQSENCNIYYESVRGTIKSFCDKLLHKIKNMSFSIEANLIQDTLDRYFAARKQMDAMLQSAEKSMNKRQRERKDILAKQLIWKEKFEKRKNYRDNLMKKLHRITQEREQIKVIEETMNSNKQLANDLLVKAENKEKEMLKMKQNLVDLKQTLNDIKMVTNKNQAIRSRERDAKKARIKELKSMLERVNAELHQKETTLGNQKKASVASLKPHHEKLEELESMFHRLQVVNNKQSYSMMNIKC